MFGVAWLTPTVLAGFCGLASMLIQAGIRLAPTTKATNPVLTWIESALSKVNPGFVSQVFPNNKLSPDAIANAVIETAASVNAAPASSTTATVTTAPAPTTDPLANAAPDAH